MIPSNLNKPSVLFEDRYAKVWIPLSELYFSASSSMIVSKHPLSVLREAVNHYCPQCLKRYLDEDVNTFKSKCPSCLSCPLCFCILPKPQNGSLTCGFCRWNSQIAGLEGEDSRDFEFAVIENDRDSSAARAFDAVVEFENGSTIEKLSVPISNFLSNQRPTDISTDEQDATPESIFSSLEQRTKSIQPSSPFISDLFPCQVPLRSRFTLRCRKDMLEGNLNLLIQPKPLPLEGDSSMLQNRGKWFVKDASAVHVLPSIIITRLPKLAQLLRGERSLLQFMVLNPRSDSSMNLTFQLGQHSLKQGGITHESAIVTDYFDVIQINTLFGDSSSSFTVSLEPYEDELLRDEDSDERAAVSAAGGSDSGASVLEAWQAFVSHDTATIFAPIFLQSREMVPTTNSAPPSAQTVCELPLTITVATVNTSGEVLHTIVLRCLITFPL